MSVGKIQMLDGLVSTLCTKKPILNINFLDKERWGVSNLLPFSIVIFQQIPFLIWKKKLFVFKFWAENFSAETFDSRPRLNWRFEIFSELSLQRPAGSVRPSVRSFVCPSVHWLIKRCTSLAIVIMLNVIVQIVRPSVHLSVRLSVRPTICLSVRGNAREATRLTEASLLNNIVSQEAVEYLSHT